jgi:hypothetical protein
LSRRGFRLQALPVVATCLVLAASLSTARVTGAVVTSQAAAIHRAWGAGSDAQRLGRRHLWRMLDSRRLHVPQRPEDTSCPVTDQWTRATSVGLGAPGRGLFEYGPGPAYPGAMRHGWHGVLIVGVGTKPDRWAGAKNVWRVAPGWGYHGPVLIRGHEVGGPHQVGFNGSSLHPLRTLKINFDSAPGVHGTGGLTRVPKLGCYAWQIDGIGFSRTLVFRAMLLPHPHIRPRPEGPRWDKLANRSVRLPRLTSNASCPTTAHHTPARDHHLNVIDEGRLTRGRVYGQGPVFPLINPESVRLWSRWHGIGAWYATPITWAVDSRYRGPVLIRGRQLDGPARTQFQTAVPGPRRVSVRLRSPRPSEPRRSLTTQVRVPGPGCYGWQIDGYGFSQTIVLHLVR